MIVEDEHYEYPPVELLSKADKKTLKGGAKALTETATKLQKTLYSFGVSAKVENVSVGPAITRYELKPAEGVRVSKIANALDKALSKYKAKDTSILSKMLDMEKVKYNDKFEIVEGLEDQINSIKQSHDYLFDNDNPLPTFTGANPNNNPSFNNKELSLGEALKEKFK